MLPVVKISKELAHLGSWKPQFHGSVCSEPIVARINTDCGKCTVKIKRRNKQGKKHNIKAIYKTGKSSNCGIINISREIRLDKVSMS